MGLSKGALLLSTFHNRDQIAVTSQQTLRLVYAGDLVNAR